MKDEGVIFKREKPHEGLEVGLFSKIKWLMFFRAMVVTLFLGATAIVQIKESQFFYHTSPFILYSFIGFTYALTLAYAFLLKWIKRLQAFAYGQILADVFFVTLLIYLTGGIESVFSWLYLLPIFGASAILYRRGGLLVASASSILYGTLLDLEYYQVILPWGSRFALPVEYKSSYVFYLIIVNILAFYLVAILSAYLSEQVRSKEEELRERLIDYNQLEQLYKHIVQNVTSGLVTVDQAGRVTSFNRMAEEITGYKLEEVYQKEVGNVFPGFLNLSRSNGIASETEGKNFYLSRWETKFQRKDGAVMTLGFSVSPLKNSAGEEIGIIFIFQDLTRMREMEEDLKRADRLAAIGTLAAGMAHEIRNPLASISGSIEILKEEMDGAVQHQPLMEIILREVGRLNSLIGDFLLFARPTLPGKEIIHLNEIAEEVLKIFAHSPECTPEIHLAKHFQDEIYMPGDAQQIKQIFWNLVINAAQAMPGGGELRVELHRRPAPSNPGELPQGEIVISDTGTGIREEDLDKIFNPFFTTKEKGTGLGLSIVHKIVESYGGKIMIRSQLDQGATFTIILPINIP
jgi:two-component system sensor histidine kinase PilS (NtrC family)